MSVWNIYCDFDGTISNVDVIDVLLERFGLPGWTALEDAWRAGRIGSRACMSGQVALLDLDHSELDACLAKVEIDPAFATFVAQTRRLGLPLQILSDGLDYCINSIMGRHHLGDLPVAANQLRSISPRRWTLDSPSAAAGCASGTCKCACVDRSRIPTSPTLLIGDGASDFCAAGHVDFVFAKHRLIDHCRRNDIPHVAICGFDEAIALLPLLLDGSLSETAQPRRRLAQA